MKALLSLLFATACLAPAAHAALGDKLSDPVPAGRKVIAAAAANTAGYSVRTSLDPAGITIREYAAADGTVFAVTWNGSDIPDLSALLGKSRFAEYTRAIGEGNGNRRRAEVAGPDLVVQSFGRGMTFRGRAWLKSLLPAGVPVDVIQ
ncbi:DUF2844 domain-containing protein [Paludibacterium paludis]|uniref:DUF2844 domain-containing protein n=1 Tax=Paludibacterium paludis TaxID=1225769 RepID=A0A918P0T5_9NEIS|nr:DUF2844 domain-containing protein [Paludibacterium paludis]GGY12092.1 hypothetical protein GCM10011289_13920 [Paludibacterium paludis]